MNEQPWICPACGKENWHRGTGADPGSGLCERCGVRSMTVLAIIKRRCKCGQWEYDEEIGMYKGETIGASGEKEVSHHGIGGNCLSCGDELGIIAAGRRYGEGRDY